MDRPLREGVSYNRDTGDRTSAPAPPPIPVTAEPMNDGDDDNSRWFDAQGVPIPTRLFESRMLDAFNSRLEARLAALGHAAPPSFNFNFYDGPTFQNVID